MDELTIGDKTYISSKRAAEITGYAKDYVGQLCRGGYVEAKMVGRSWYVLESSIRAHRFRDENPSETAPEPAREEKPTLSTWEAPSYAPETVQELPKIVERETPPAAADAIVAPATETIADMQAAWKEWFETRREPLLESPEVIEERNHPHDEPQEVQEEPEEELEEEETALETVKAPEQAEATPIEFYKIPEPKIEPVQPAHIDIVPIRRMSEESQVIEVSRMQQRTRGGNEYHCRSLTYCHSGYCYRYRIHRIGFWRKLRAAERCPAVPRRNQYHSKIAYKLDFSSRIN